MVLKMTPKVAAARSMAQQFGRDIAVLVLVDLEGRTVEVASYGTDETKCSKGQALADALYTETLVQFKRRRW